MATKFPQLATHLRSWGLKVNEVAGWQTRSANSTTFTPKAVIVHHTATAGPANAPSLGIVRDGRTGVPGPLSQFLLARDGQVYLISGNRANHAGLGGPRAGVPANMGNQYCWGIEAENDGRGEPWPAAQLQAYYRLCAALCDLMDVSEQQVFAHKEWAPSRKTDPGGLDMAGFRANVKKAIVLGTQPAVPLTPNGDRWLGLYNPPLTGQDVKNVQNVLLMAGNASVKPEYDKATYGAETSRVLNIFKENRGIVERGCGPLTWEALREYIRTH